jgi:hypothetical protein
MYVVSFPKVPYVNPTKANHRGMKVEDLAKCQKEINDLLARGLIVPLDQIGHVHDFM